MPLRSIHTCYLLGVNYGVIHLLNNGLYCTKLLSGCIQTCYLVNFAWTEKFNNGLCTHFYHPPKKLWEGNVFTPVHSVHKGVGCMMSLPVWLHGPSGGSAYWEGLAPPYWHLVAVTKVGGTHPTGMHSCLWSCGLKSSRNSSRLINHRCEWTFRLFVFGLGSNFVNWRFA